MKNLDHLQANQFANVLCNV